MAEKKREGLVNLVRNANQKVKATQAVATNSGAGGGGLGGGPKIFSVLEYIEQPWGLAMNLYPAQRFLVKLYYNLELDTKIPDDPNKRIQVTDMLKTKILYELSERDYLTYLFNEGRCNIGEQDHDRRELVLSIGRRGGKCVCGDTLVLTNDGIRQIADLGTALEDGFSPLELGIVQEAGKRSTSAAFYNGGVKPTFSVKTDSGYSLKGTGPHRVKVLTKTGKVEWVYLDQLQVGDFVAINRSTDLWAAKLMDLRPFHNETGRKDVRLPELLDERLGNFIGYLVGDGTWGDDHAVSVTVEHPETWAYLKEAFQTLLGEPRVQMDERTVNTGRLEFCSVRARRFFDDIGWKQDCARDQKMIPWSILQSPKSVVCAFLRGLFETDGCAESGGRSITFSSASFRLAHEVQIVLLNLGIVSNVARKWNSKTKKHYANLRVKGTRSRRLFAQLIGFDSDKKRLPMLASLELAQEGKSDTESIPHQYSAIRDWLESIPKAGPGAGHRRSRLRDVLANTCKPSSGEDLTYPRLAKAISVAKEMGAGEQETAHFEELARLDYFYDAVTSVEQGEDQVYDLTVPDGEAFVANGMTNHNTTLSGIFASYEVYRLLNLYNPQEYYGLPNGNRIQIISVATDKDQAGLLFNEVASHIVKCEYFKPHTASNTQTFLNFRTPYDIEKFGTDVRNGDGKYQSLNGKATIRVTFKGANGKGLRGAGNVVIILDEVAHFLDKGGGSAEEVYGAVVPSSAAFSKKDQKTKRALIDPITGIEAPVESRVILISSPLGKSGLFYDKFDLAMRGGPGAHNILAIQAPTWEINPTVPSSYYKEKYHANPITFVTEHGAQFSDQVRGWIERESDLQACINPILQPKLAGTPRSPHQMGIDVGLVNDGTAIAITHVEGDKIVLDYHEIWYAGENWREANPHLDFSVATDYAKSLGNVQRIDFDAIGEWILALCKRFHITAGIFDRWNGIPLEQFLHKHGLKQFTSDFYTRDNTSKMYQTVKEFMYDEKLELYDFPIPERAKDGSKHSPLIAELLTLQAEQISKNIVTVQAPNKVGAHDDLSDALIRSIWLSSEVMMNRKHTAHGQAYRPAVASAMTPQRYQMSRMLKHGGGGDRSLSGRRPIRQR